MALEPKNKKTAKAPAAKKTVAKKPAAKKSPVKKAVVKKTPIKKQVKNSETITKKDPPMGTNENTHTNEGLKDGLGNAKLEQTGTVADKVWRLIAMIAFAFMANFALFAIVVLSALQFVVVFMEGKPNKELQSIITKLESYLSEAIAFLSYKTDVMPFPFSSLPKSKK